MARNTHMKENKRGTKFKNFGGNVKNFFTTNSKNAKIHSIKLAFALIVCVIAGIFTFYLAKPAIDLKVSSEKAMSSYSELINYTGDEEGLAAVQEKQTKAKDVYTGALKSYQENSNPVIAGYAKIQNGYVQLAIVLAMIAPFVLTIILMAKHPVKTLFALLNVAVIYPGLLIKNVVGSIVSNVKASIKEAKENKKVSSTRAEEA